MHPNDGDNKTIENGYKNYDNEISSFENVLFTIFFKNDPFFSASGVILSSSRYAVR